MFRVAVSSRREQEASFFTVVVWRDQAEHAAESLSKGSRVVVLGRLQQRSWTAEDGSARSTIEVVAEELGAEPAVGDGDHDQDHAEPGPLASSTSDATGRDHQNAARARSSLAQAGERWLHRLVGREETNRAAGDVRSERCARLTEEFAGDRARRKDCLR
jgi:single stranded DNA-binding protein